jgi:hydrogenase maturation protein HypF
VVGLVLDGLGLGPDGTIWGGEVLIGDYADYARLAWLKPAPLIGGDAANRQPWRNLLARLDDAELHELAGQRLSGKPLATLRRAAELGVNAPLSSSAGRLFDAFAAWLDLAPEEQSFEGEAAMALEALAMEADEPGFAWRLAREGGVIDPSPLFDPDALKQMEKPALAYAFHATLARAFAKEARTLVEAGTAAAVVLSGGCFQNALLLDLTLRELDGLPVLHHRAIPPNDGGLALGQATVAMARSLR